MRKESDFEASVEKQLRKAKLKYVKQPVVGETRPDFLVTTYRGDQIVVDVKAWEPNAESLTRAIHHAHLYKELSNVAAALIVTGAQAPITLPVGAVAPAANFLGTLREITDKLAKTKRRRKPIKTRPSPKKKVFTSMPYRSKYDDTFLVAIQPAALALNAVADRVDHTGRSGDVVQQIKEMIKAAQVVVADLSDSRPNVCHEVGYAEALGRPVIQICSSPLTSLPFNVRNNRTIPYSIGQTSRLRSKLKKELRKLL